MVGLNRICGYSVSGAIANRIRASDSPKKPGGRQARSLHHNSDCKDSYRFLIEISWHPNLGARDDINDKYTRGPKA